MEKQITLPRVFLFALVAYFFCASGYIDTVDAEPSIEMAKAVWNDGHLWVKKAPLGRPFYFPNVKDGGIFHYSKMGLGYPIAYLPGVVMADIAGRFGAPQELILKFYCSLVNGIACAALVAVLFYVSRKRGLSAAQAAMLSLAIGFATAIFPYAKTCHREPMQALAITMMFAFVITARTARRPWLHFLLAGLGGTMGLLVKSVFLIVAFPAMAFAVLEAWGSEERRKRLLAFFLPFVFAVVLYLAYNAIAFQSPLTTGHNAKLFNLQAVAWNVPFWEGLYRQWLDPELSLLVYSPVLLLALAYLADKIRKKQATRADIFLIGAIVLQSVFYAKWAVGSFLLGSRFLIVIIPLFALLVDRFPELPRRAWVRRGLVAVIFAWSLFLQIVNVSVKAQQYQTMKDSVDPSTLIFDETGEATYPSQWATNVRLFFHKLSGKPERYLSSELRFPSEMAFDLEEHRSLRGFNFWWSHLRHLPTPPPRSETIQ